MFLLILVVSLGDIVAIIPMAALVAIMIMVSIGTFSWSSIKNLRDHPKSSSIVMLATVFFVIYTHNLAIGVLVGVLLSGIFFAWKISQLFRVRSTITPDGNHRTYTIEGQLFFASSEDFMKAFDFKEALEKVAIDLSRAAYLGHFLGCGAGHGCAQVPPGRRRGRVDRPEQGVRNHR